MPSEAVDQRRSGAEGGHALWPSDLGSTEACHVESSARSQKCRDSLSRLDVQLHMEERLAFAIEEHGNHLSLL
jgi:hypothetical protein